MTYGKCYEKAWKLRAASRTASPDAADNEAHSKAFEKRIADSIAECGQGRALLPDLKVPDKADRVEPGFDWNRLAAQAEKRPASIYFERWNTVLDGGTRGTIPIR